METPCIKICKLKDGVCYGCGRTTTEIANWSRYTTEERSTGIPQRTEKPTSRLVGITFLNQSKRN